VEGRALEGRGATGGSWCLSPRAEDHLLDPDLPSPDPDVAAASYVARWIRESKASEALEVGLDLTSEDDRDGGGDGDQEEAREVGREGAGEEGV